MKTNLLRLMAFTVVLIMLFAASVGPVLAKDGKAKSIAFVDVGFVAYRGFVFKFKVTGDFKAKDLTGFITYSGNRYALHCANNSTGDLSCLADSGVGKLVGKSVSGVLAGITFTAVIPARIYPRIYCYGIFDYSPDLSTWNVIGQHCKAGAAIDPSINYYNPAWGETYTYYYYNNGSSATCQNPPAPDWGPGYYYDDPDYCPNN